MSKFGRIYNLKKDTIDGSEYKFKVKYLTAKNLPESFDLRNVNKWIPPILDQGQLGACGPNAISNALRYCIAKENDKDPKWQPSRLYIYYFTRLLEGSPVEQDTGISIKGGMKATSKHSACSENNWPYIISRYAIAPPPHAIKAAQSHLKKFVYLSVQQDLVTIKQALISGYPIVIGIQVYESFESDAVAKSGIVPMPNIDKEKCLGGHACTIYGYSDKSKKFICSNCWNSTWGDKGYFTIPYDYILNKKFAYDFWTCRLFK
jgi:C1A family cysteine protease